MLIPSSLPWLFLVVVLLALQSTTTTAAPTKRKTVSIRRKRCPSGARWISYPRRENGSRVERNNSLPFPREK